MERQSINLCLVLALLVLFTGCISHPSPVGPTHQTPQSSPESGACPEWVSFYGLDSPGQTTWDTDRVSIGYTVPAGASVFFVAFDTDNVSRVIGVEHVSTEGYEAGVTADGDGIRLEDELYGSHTINVVAYRDVNGNDQFDFETDQQCMKGGEPVETGPKEINFTQFKLDTVVTPSPGSPTQTS